MPKIFLIILNYKLKAVILDCLASTAQLKVQGFELTTVVVDNNSQDNLEQDLKEKFPLVHFLQTGDNLGYAGGNNVGITYALDHGADFVCVINPDVTVDPDLILQLYQGFTSDDIGITSPKIYFAPGFEFHKDRYQKSDLGKVIWYAGGLMDWQNIIGHHRGVDAVDTGQFDEAMDIEYASGNCLMIKRSLFEKIGLLDERYFMYYEDADFSLRAKKAGFRIRFVPQAKLWHLNAQSAGGSGSALQDYFISRNRLLFGFTYAGVRTKIALLREIACSSLKYRTRRLALVDFICHRFGKGSYIK